MAITGDATSTVPAGTLPYTDKLVETLILEAVQDTFMLPAHPAIIDVTEIARSLNAVRGLTLAGTINIQIDDAAQVWAGTNEGTAVSAPTQIDPTYVEMSVANYDVSYGSTDELRRRDATGLYNWPRISQRVVLGWMLTETDLLCDLADSMTNIVGATTDPCSWDLIREARDELTENGEHPVGNFLTVLHTAQMALVKADIESRGGAVQMRRDLDEMQIAGRGNYVGTYDGIDFFETSRINVAAGVYSGMMVAPGALGVLRIPQAEATVSQIRILDIGGGMITVEEVRDSDDKQTRWVGAATVGFSIIHQSKAVRIRSTGRT